MPTPTQLQLIHWAARQLWGKDCDASYRLLLHNAAGVASAKHLTQPQFEDAMAVMEDLGFHDFRDPNYWRRRVEARGQWANSRMVWLIGELAYQVRYELPALCDRFSEGRASTPAQLRPKEAWNLIEMLKAVQLREGSREQEVLNHGRDVTPNSGK